MSEDIEIISDVAVGFQSISGLSLKLPLISSSTEVASGVPGAIACKKYLCTGSSKSATMFLVKTFLLSCLRCKSLPYLFNFTPQSII